MKTGSDHETLVTTLAGRGQEPSNQFHFKVSGKQIPQFMGLIEVGMASLPVASRESTIEQVEDLIERF
jgi:hypothetical protein